MTTTNPTNASMTSSTSPVTSNSADQSSAVADTFVALAAVLGRCFRGLFRACREAVWVVRTLPHLVFLLAALLLAALWFGTWWQASGPSLGLVGLLTYPRTAPKRWARVTDSALAHEYRTTWKDTATAIGLCVPHRSAHGLTSVHGVVPLLRKVRAADGAVTLRLHLSSGLTLDAVENAVPALQAHVGAHAVRVVPDGPSHVELVLTHRDAVGHIVELPDVAPRPTGTNPAGTSGVDHAPAIELVGGKLPRVTIGAMSTGTPWELNTCVHTLVAGCTGAGKGSVMWSTLAGLAPLVDTGYVRLIGIDLKGGMELAWARNLFAHLATTPADAVALVEQLAAEVQATAHRLAGNAREHHVTRDNPFTILVIDELGMLTSFNSDSKLRNRFETAIGVYLSQGRAPGYSVLAFVQDPRRDSVPHRGLFGQAIALRFKESTETVMVLGETAATMAPAHRIPISTPGVAYTIDETGLVLKARAFKVTDDHLRALASRYSTCHYFTPNTPAVSAASAAPAASVNGYDLSALRDRFNPASDAAATNVAATSMPVGAPVAPPAGTGPAPARPATTAPTSRPRRARAPRRPRTPTN